MGADVNHIFFYFLSVLTAGPPMFPMKEGCVSETPSAEKLIEPENDLMIMIENRWF